MDGTDTSCGEPHLTGLAGTYIYEFSLWTPPSAPYASSWEEFSNVHLANTWLREITGGNHFLRVRPHMASAVTLKDEIQHGATHAAKLTWLLQFSASVRSRFPSKKLQVGSSNVDEGSTVAVQANISSRKAVESYNSRRYWGGETVHPRWREKIIP